MERERERQRRGSREGDERVSGCPRGVKIKKTG